MKSHKLNISVYYGDTDAGGVMYHGTHLDFAERARTEWLRDIGHQNSDLRSEFGMIFVVKHLDIEYVGPAFLDDMLRMETTILEIKNSSFTMHQRLYCENRDDALVSDMRCALVCVDEKNIRPMRIPAELRKALEDFVE